MLEFIFELVIEFFGEFILQLLAEAFGGAVRAGWLRLTGRGREVTSGQDAGWALLLGTGAGLLTVFLLPQLAIHQPLLRMLNLVLAPLAAGLLVERMKALRARRRAFSWSGFAYPALFGLAFAGTRALFGH